MIASMHLMIQVQKVILSIGKELTLLEKGIIKSMVSGAARAELDYMDAFVAHREEVAQRSNTEIEVVEEECDMSEDEACADVSGGGNKRRRTTSAANDASENV
jgi:hypothetical protein